MKLLYILLSVLVIGLIASKCNSSSSVSSPTATPTATKTEIVQPVWSYNSYTDSMTGGSGKYATTLSTNSANLEFPYQGSQQAKLTVTEDDIVHLSVEKGQITCGEQCKILVKFNEDDQARDYIWRNSGDKSDRVVSWDKQLVKRIYASKHMTIRIGFFQNDSVDFEFNVADLKPFEARKIKKRD